MGFDFSLVDVFSDQPFGGNQLAVFPDAAGIADETMQRLAREFNFSETTFVLPPSDPSFTHQVRIFTPRQELPFAGHPTVGTAAVLASLSDDGAAERRFVFEEGIGPVTVTVDGPAIRFRLRQRSRTAPTISRSPREWPWGAQACWRAPLTRRTARSPRLPSVAEPRSSATAP